MNSGDDGLEERVVETVTVNASEVVAKPLGVKEYPKVVHATEEEEDEVLEENTIDGWVDDAPDDLGDDAVGDDADVSAGS